MHSEWQGFAGRPLQVGFNVFVFQSDWWEPRLFLKYICLDI